MDWISGVECVQPVGGPSQECLVVISQREQHPGILLALDVTHRETVAYFFSAAWAAARIAIGTRKGLQLT